jgi:predicted phage-related endonuclease
MLASIDRLSKDGKRVVELKTCSAYHQNEWGEPGTDEVPEAYLVQVTHQLAVSGLQIADIAVLIGGTDFRIYTVERSDALIDRLVEIENDFWTRVCHEIPPEPDWSDRHTPRLLEALHGLDESMLVNLDDAALSVCDEWLMWKEHQKLADEKVLEYKGRLLDKLGPCGTGVLPDGRLLVRKQVHRNPYTVEAGTYTTMRIKKAKVST